MTGVNIVMTSYGVIVDIDIWQENVPMNAIVHGKLTENFNAVRGVDEHALVPKWSKGAVCKTVIVGSNPA